METAWYEASLDELRRIADAKEVRVKVVGAQYYDTKHLTKANMENFRKFLAEYGEEQTK